MSNVTLYHKDYCPYCKAAQQLLNKKGIPFNAIDVTSNPVEFNNMLKRSGRRTVPQIFFGDTHIGGFDDLNVKIKNNTFPFEKLNASAAY